MNLLAWELTCYRANIRDVISLFEVSRELSSLSKGKRLWHILLKRDFPKHFLLIETNDARIWYQDLYQYGAFFLANGSVTLWPRKPVMIAKQSHFNEVIIIMTILEKNYNVVISNVNHIFFDLRFPGQKWVTCIQSCESLTQEQGEKLKTLDSRIVTRYSDSDRVMLHSSEPIDLFMMKEIEKWDGSRFDKIIFIPS
jgi:hypothetical protein